MPDESLFSRDAIVLVQRRWHPYRGPLSPETKALRKFLERERQSLKRERQQTVAEVSHAVGAGVADAEHESGLDS